MKRSLYASTVITIVLAAFPAAGSAQSASTLEMVQNMSMSAGSNPDLALAREDAGKPFGSAVTLSQGVQTGNGSRQPAPPAPENRGAGNNPGQPANPGNHYSPGQRGGNPPPLVVVQSHGPYGPGYRHLTPVIPGSAISIIMGVLAIALLVLLCI